MLEEYENKFPEFVARFRRYYTGMYDAAYMPFKNYRVDGTEDVSEYFQKMNKMFREIVAPSNPFSTLEEYVVCEHSDAFKECYKSTFRMLRNYVKLYVEDLENLKKTAVLYDFVQTFIHTFPKDNAWIYVPQEIWEEYKKGGAKKSTPKVVLPRRVQLPSVKKPDPKPTAPAGGDARKQKLQAFKLRKLAAKAALDAKKNTPTPAQRMLGKSIINKNLSSIKEVLQSPVCSSPIFNPGITEDIFEEEKLQKVMINEKVINDFLKYAHESIEMKVEFCGMLCGNEIVNPGAPSVFHITHCLIPDQRGNENTVECQGEHKLHDYRVNCNLITIGWIHTHPTQSAFLSSMDIYTQYGYQCMMKEFVAVVCSPRKQKKMGFFRIKDDKMDEIGNLTKSDRNFGRKLISFREKMYEKCKHCDLSKDVSSKVVDLRSIKKVRLIREDPFADF